MTQWRWAFSELRTRIWFRAALISLLSVFLALAGAILAPIIPYEWSLTVGGDAVDAILSILASSMLAVTTFSLTAMVAAFSGAAQQVTPRAVHLLIQDRIAQNALSTFLGGFVFSLVSIVALTTGIYGREGRVILFFGTILMAITIVISLLRWIARLVNFGRVDDAIKMIEERGECALADYPGDYLLVGRPLVDRSGPAFFDKRTGYLAHIDRAKLAALADKAGVEIRMAVAAGDFVDPTVPIAYASSPLDEQCSAQLREALAITRNRSFDLDPRFGTTVLSEIALRALSPAVNDPGTAVEVLGAAQRLLDSFAKPRDEPEKVAGVTILPVSFEEMVEVLVLPIARDSARLIEVGGRLQHMLGALAEQIPETRPFLKRLAAEALARNHAADLSDADRERIDRAHQRAFDPARVVD